MEMEGTTEHTTENACYIRAQLTWYTRAGQGSAECVCVCYAQAHVATRLPDIEYRVNGSDCVPEVSAVVAVRFSIFFGGYSRALRKIPIIAFMASLHALR